MKPHQKKSSYPDMMIIEPMCAADLPGVMDIENVSYLHPWILKSFEDELARDFALCLCARIENQLAGYLICWAVRDEIHILNLALKSDFQGHGLARSLLDYLFDWGREKKAAKVLLEVRMTNHRARKMYEKAGFIMTGRRKNYYAKEGEDALMMARSLKS